MVKLVILPKEENDEQRTRRNNLHHFPFHRSFLEKGGLRASVLDLLDIEKAFSPLLAATRTKGSPLLRNRTSLLFFAARRESSPLGLAVMIEQLA